MKQNNLGNYDTIYDVWRAYPEGGKEGDYLFIDGVEYVWDKYGNKWMPEVSDEDKTLESFYGEVDIHKGLHVGEDVTVNGNLITKGAIISKKVSQPSCGLFSSVEALRKAYPKPYVGMWAAVGDAVPAPIYRCETIGVWTPTGDVGYADGRPGKDGEKGDKGDTGERGPQGLQGNSGYTGAADELEVVNNLTQGGATAALSAEAGMGLHNRVIDLEQVLLGDGYEPPTILTGTAQGEGNYSNTARWQMFTGLEAGLIMRIKITANTDIIYSSADNAEHTFVDVVYYPTGTTTPTNVIWENRGNVGDKYLAGTTLYEGEYTLPEAADVWLRGRFVGNATLQVTYGGRDGEGIVKAYKELQDTVDVHEVLISTLKQELNETINNHGNRISKVEQELDDLLGPGYVPPTIILGEAVGVGDYSSTQRWKIAEMQAGTTAHVILKAETDIAFSSSTSTESTFVDVYKYDSGTTNNGGFLFENRGAPGDTIAAGTIIYEGDYTFENDSDVYIRGRFLGTASLTLSYGGSESFNAEEAYKSLKGVAEDHEARIKTLETGTTSDIISQYKHQVARALQLGYVESRSTAYWPISPLVFAHISDTHSMTNNARAIQLLNYLGENGPVQFLMHTGDILEDPKNASQSRWAGAVAEANYPVMVTAGNHDVGNWETASGKYTTSAQFYDAFITPQVASWGLKTDGGGSPFVNGRNYYFKDFTAEKVRFIVVDEYELPSQFGSDGTTLLAGRGARWISQAQTDWFVEALRTTPDGYGVIVAKHAPDGKRGEDNNPFNSPFLKGKEHQQSYQYYGGAAYTTFFADIVQAFIDKTTLSKTIQQEAGTITGSVTITADFSTTAGREFICYVTGHTHADGINFLKDYPKQLDLNINCDNTFYQHYSDLYLAEGTMCEDAINVYSIDRNRGVIHVVRIGGEYSADGDRRDILTIRYK